MTCVCGGGGGRGSRGLCIQLQQLYILLLLKSVLCVSDGDFTFLPTNALLQQVHFHLWPTKLEYTQDCQPTHDRAVPQSNQHHAVALTNPISPERTVSSVSSHTIPTRTQLQQLRGESLRWRLRGRERRVAEHHRIHHGHASCSAGTSCSTRCASWWYHSRYHLREQVTHNVTCVHKKPVASLQDCTTQQVVNTSQFCYSVSYLLSIACISGFDAASCDNIGFDWILQDVKHTKITVLLTFAASFADFQTSFAFVAE
jgi:hypothetical protein